MKQKLQQLLIKYANEDRYSDKDFVVQVLEILIQEYGDNGLKCFSILEKEQNGISDFENSLIGINLEFIKNNLLSQFCYDDKKSNLYLVNIYVILVLMHEFNHFRQRKKIEYVIDSNDMLDKLFVKSYVFLCSNNVDVINKTNHTNYTSMLEVEEFYNAYHNCFAVERLAQMEAYKNLIDIISPISSVVGKPYYWLLNNYYAYKISEYYIDDGEILSPLDLMLAAMSINNYEQLYEPEEYIDEELDREDEGFDNEIISSYSIYDRICYGLQITEKEYFDTVDFMNVMYSFAGNKGVVYDKSKIKIRKKDVNN